MIKHVNGYELRLQSTGDEHLFVVEVLVLAFWWMLGLLVSPPLASVGVAMIVFLLSPSSLSANEAFPFELLCDAEDKSKQPTRRQERIILHCGANNDREKDERKRDSASLFRLLLPSQSFGVLGGDNK